MKWNTHTPRRGGGWGRQHPAPGDAKVLRGEKRAREPGYLITQRKAHLSQVIKDVLNRNCFKYQRLLKMEECVVLSR